MAENKLAHISGDLTATKATIVVGGIHDTYNHFKDWGRDLGAPDTLLVGFDHDHQSSSMTEAGRDLAQVIRALKAQGFEELTVVAHSMGGLVSKAALDELVTSGEAQEFKSIDFHALGTPWGGFALAGIPGSSFFGPMLGYPMAGEMAPGSDFMEGLSKVDWPEHMTFSVYQGTADNISQPSVLATHERYDEIVDKANEFVVLENYGHSDYIEAGAQVLTRSMGLGEQAFASAGSSAEGPAQLREVLESRVAGEQAPAEALELEMD